ncbi:MAG: hypothetical protein QM756_24045 [Polyangiaceae bacterium]
MRGARFTTCTGAAWAVRGPPPAPALRWPAAAQFAWCRAGPVLTSPPAPLLLLHTTCTAVALFFSAPLSL